MTTSAHWSNPSRLKTRHLMLLLHLDEQGSVLRAAESARMTQPAASKLLAEMEALLGVTLFDRHARGVHPTWYGQVLIRRARSALLEIGRAQEEIAALRDGRMGQASIGTVVNPGTNLVPQAVAEVKKSHPDILVRIDMDYSRPLVARLLDGQLDLVVGRIMDPQGGIDLEFEPLSDEPHWAIVRHDHPLAAQKSVRHADLAPYGWIMPPPDSVLRNRLETMFLERGLQGPRNVVETSSLPVIINLLRASDLVTALPLEAVTPYVETRQLAVLRLELGVGMESFGIVRRRGHLLSPAAQRVLEALRSVAQRLYAR
ncbi:galactose-binding protein [Pseudoxanthomonas broegbernensis]|uniref:Galactose-binding protein n=1 Tax=Pseudoxanthomonas broegbernensis TaxID=83619 RepID=A0A7V8K6I1_9GAMM|nr:LysR substrate-binding domain-containing protein [Pseudoxanthomonas broegbernensis]KAF1685926.1 galactose-binding protein [Pseudoxanthomonas broegbernensis]MBB6064156.1 DNA-binding transcriptional LysR family regulator [Pseudoxanthomonas broegbernensis]